MGVEGNPRVLVLRTAGVNCDEETAHAFRLAGGNVETVHVGAFLRGERSFDEFHVLAFPGGFSYGDDLGAGTVLANQLRSHLSDELRAFVDSGRLVLGICNGFQVLVRLGLLPGWDGEPAVALVENHSAKFEDRWVQLAVETERCPFLVSQAGQVVRFPVAHKEGRFVVRDAEVLARLEGEGQIVLRYTGASGDAGGVSYPANPNGSVADIAGISNPQGNVLGLMPHPERHLRRVHDPQWTRRVLEEGFPQDEERAGDGYTLFANALEYAREQLGVC